MILTRPVLVWLIKNVFQVWLLDVMFTIVSIVPLEVEKVRNEDLYYPITVSDKLE